MRASETVTQTVARIAGVRRWIDGTDGSTTLHDRPVTQADQLCNGQVGREA